MCGFVGFTNGNETQRNSQILIDMTNRIKHRGPDDVNYYIDDNVSLGFRRLSIIDLDTGKQPILNEDGSKVLVFNGEIYNYISLRQELIKKGHIFTTKTDSEVLLHGYEEWGSELLKKVRGMFAFVIWDKNKKELFGARDPFGIKPFYYAQMGQTFLFGSEIKAFLPHPHFKKELNHNALEQYLSFQYSVGTQSFFKQVYKLAPAHYFIYKNATLLIERYWQPKFENDDSLSLKQWTDKIDTTFKQSVEVHKIANVKIGSFLSSGVDSSYITSTAKVDKTFTVGFNEEKEYDETAYSKELSKNLNMENMSKYITSQEYFNAFEDIQYYMDEPLADPSAVALYFLCNLASKHVKVCLSGEGADELFGGYNTYTEPFFCPLYYKIPLSMRRTIGKAASYFPEKRGFNMLVRRGETLSQRYIGNANIFNEAERKSLLKHSTSAKSPKDFLAPLYNQVRDKHEVTAMQYIDINTWLVSDILLKADKMSMANSLEVRVPFLDKELMKIASHIPVAYKVNKSTTKIALRQAASRTLPQKYADKKKLGFPIPIREWIKQEDYFQLIQATFQNEISKTFFDTELLIKLLQDHKANKQDNSRKIWTVYTFLVWYYRFFVVE